MERRYVLLIGGVAAALGAIVIVGLFFNPMHTQGENAGSTNVIKAKIGQQVYIRYSSSVIAQIQNLPTRNNVIVEVSSELHNTNLAGLRGEVRYTQNVISFVQNGKGETVTDDVFPTIEYRFSPDAGNKTTYSYENVRFVATSEDAQLIVIVVPLKTAEVGERYAVKLIMDGGGLVKYAIAEKVIEIVP